MSSSVSKNTYTINPFCVCSLLQELFMACLEDMKTLPQCYQIHEMTSLTGGMFNPGLALTFEKQLLIMVLF